MASMSDSIQFPAFESIDPSSFEIFLDLDLDQLTVLFYGRNRRYTANPRNDVLSVLEDPGTNEVLGISLDRFAQQVLVEHPEMLAMAAAATVLVGDDLILPGEFLRFAVEQPFMARLAGSFNAARRAWTDAGGTKTGARRIYQNLLQIA